MFMSGKNLLLSIMICTGPVLLGMKQKDEEEGRIINEELFDLIASGEDLIQKELVDQEKVVELRKKLVLSVQKHSAIV
jgi:hypothetical protein